MSADAVILEQAAADVALIRLGAPAERRLLLSAERLDSLQAAIRYLKKNRPRGLILTGPHLEMFGLGSDLRLLRDATQPQDAVALSREGHKLCAEIAGLPFAVVAAVSGPCFGIACEIALSCRYRLLSDSKKTVLSLPEVELGLIPFFGATQSLPRLIGLPKALLLLLSGKPIYPRQALEAGLVHEMVPLQKLEERALEIATSGVHPSHRRLGIFQRLATFTGAGRAIVRKKALKAVLEKTRGHYPAPGAALDVAVYGLRSGLELGYAREAKEFSRLINSPEAQALLHLYEQRQAAEALSACGRKPLEITPCVVIGAGRIGCALAALLARHDYPVILKDISQDVLTRAMHNIRDQLSRCAHLTETERSFVVNRIETTTADSAGISNAGLVIEAVSEELEVKKKVLSEVSKLAPPEAIIATSMASLNLKQVASAIENSTRAVGLHFTYPADKVRTVEIVHAAATSNKTLALIAGIIGRLEKYPVVVEDTPGFLTNRMLGSYFRESIQLLIEGCSADEIEQAALEFGMRRGPLSLMDEIGLETVSAMLKHLSANYGERLDGPDLVERLIKAKRLGKEGGQGFYLYQGKEKIACAGLLQDAGLPASRLTVIDSKTIAERLVLSMVNEAVRCLDEGTAGQPGAEAAGQIDLCSVYAAGFPAFRGGVLYYADRLGSKNLSARMTELALKHGKRFEAASGLSQRAEKEMSICAGI